MKTIKLFLVVLAILSGSTLFSQNWNLINKNFKYNYGIDNSGNITHTIFADSFQVNGTDTTFYLNRIISKCDTCNPGIFYLKNQGQFLQSEVLFSDSVYYFSNDHSFTIKPHAEIGESWQFDTLFNYTATVTSWGPSSTFSTPDSFKIIELTNGDNVVISKRFGILQFPDLSSSQIWSLKGIKGPGLGVVVPGFAKFYNFTIGNVFQYEEIEGITGLNNTLYYKVKKIEILDKTLAPGVFTYIAQVNLKGWTLYSGTLEDSFYVEDYIDTIQFFDSAQHICNAFNNQSIPNFNLIDPAMQPDSVLYGKASCYLHADSIWTKWMQGVGVAGNPNMQLYYTSNYDDTTLHPDLLSVAWYDDFEYLFKVGLGETRFRWQMGNQVYSRELIGYVKNGDTTGIVYNDQVYLNIETPQNEMTRLTIFPNPATRQTTIHLSNTGSAIKKISVFDLEGKHVTTLDNIFDDHYKLNLSNNATGSYFILLEDTNGKLFTKKLLKVE